MLIILSIHDLVKFFLAYIKSVMVYRSYPYPVHLLRSFVQKDAKEEVISLKDSTV